MPITNQTFSNETEKQPPTSLHQLKAFLMTHYEPQGEGSGYSIVIARNEDVARIRLWDYFLNKPGGNQQSNKPEYIEADEIHSSEYFDYGLVPWIDQETLLFSVAGVIREWHYPQDEETGSLSEEFQVLYDRADEV